MKKLTILTAVAVFSVFTFSSCRKCTTCKYTYKDSSGMETTYTYPEACGKKKDIEAYEAAAKAGAAVYSGSTVVCN